MRVFERALRRTGLPLRMSEGFHPKPRIAFPAPLGVGIESTDEVMEFDLAEWAHPADIERRLPGQLPEGIRLLSVKLGAPGQAARAAGAAYRIRLSEDLLRDQRLSQASLDSLMARENIPADRIRKRKPKTVNIRPFITSLRRDNEAIILHVKAGPEGSTRPEEVLEALGVDVESCRSRCRMIRTRVALAGERV